MVELNVTTLLVAAVSFFLVVILYLFYLERSVKRNLDYRKNLNKHYKSRLIALKGSKKSSEKILDVLDDIAKKFMKDYLKLEKELEYPQLEKEFKKVGKGDMASFCKKMTEIYYVEEEITRDEIKRAILDLQRMIEHHKIKSKIKEDRIDRIMKTLRKTFVSRVK